MHLWSNRPSREDTECNTQHDLTMDSEVASSADDAFHPRIAASISAGKIPSAQTGNNDMNPRVHQTTAIESKYDRMVYGALNPVLTSPMNGIRDSDFASMMQSSQISDSQLMLTMTPLPRHDFDVESGLIYFLPPDSLISSPAQENQLDQQCGLLE